MSAVEHLHMSPRLTPRHAVDLGSSFEKKEGKTYRLDMKHLAIINVKCAHPLHKTECDCIIVDHHGQLIKQTHKARQTLYRLTLILLRIGRRSLILELAWISDRFVVPLWRINSLALRPLVECQAGPKFWTTAL